MGWGLWLLIGLAAFFAVALSAPLLLTVRYRTGSDPQAYLRWLFLRFSLLEQEKKAKPPKQPEQPAARPQEEKKKKKKLLPAEFSDQLAMALDLFGALEEPAKLILRKFYIYRLKLDIMVAEEDAARTAIVYGQINAAVYSAYAAASNLFRIARPQIDIRPNFTAQEGEVQFELRGRLTLAVALWAALRAGGGFLARTMRRAKEDTMPERPERAQGVQALDAVEKPDAIPIRDKPDAPQRQDAPTREDNRERADRLEMVERSDAADRADRLDAVERAERPEKAQKSEREEKPDRTGKPDISP